MKNLRLTPFQPADFDRFISWLDNQELLLQIAGTYFTFPVTEDQLHNYLADPKSIAFNVVDPEQDTVIGHAEIILLGNNRVKLNATAVELLVFDWNIAGIKCYEKAGFTFADHEMPPFQIGGKSWGVKKMEINKE